MGQQDLYQLLGLAPDTPPEQLRSAYALAMQRATRAGDHQRALALSNAYDALPSQLRRDVYGGRQQIGIPPLVQPSTGITGRRRRTSGAAAAAQPSRPRGSGRHAELRRRLVAGVCALVLVAGVVFYLGGGRRSGWGSNSPAAPRPSLSAVLSTPSTVPLDAPVDSDGFAHIRCQPYHGGTPYQIAVLPGSVISCPAGAFGQYVG